ncbi:hypothetical protein QAD02_010029 [Eretmocerus hayati]|uniref:Uncharacterized protein n=1 Tax=Eretmocerus hayati TaxID=131215 RepID=A0ACC2NCD0_9HYME|nr:hypothetical protein QAD02_010029 [Eretmocerus hayati]
MNSISIRTLVLIIFGMFIEKIHVVDSKIKIQSIARSIQNIIKEVRPYQLLLLLPENESGQEQLNIAEYTNEILNNVLNSEASLLIRISTSEDYQRYAEPNYKFLMNPKASSLIICVLHATFGNEHSRRLLVFEFREHLQFLTNLSNRRTRPRCLFIIIGKSRVPDDAIESMLKYAWQKKFLDIVILQYTSQSTVCPYQLVSQSYNPFTGIYSSKCYSPKSHTFTNKLKNLHGYPLKIALVARPPNVNFDRDSQGHPIKINGSEYHTILIASEVMNFDIEWVSPFVKSYSEPISDQIPETIIDFIVKGDIDLGANHAYLHLVFSDKVRQGERSVMSYVDNFVALVPVYHMPAWIVGNSILEIILNILAHVIVMRLIVRLFRFDLRYWNQHYILQILLSNSAPKVPHKTVERLFFLSLVLISVSYSRRLYILMTDVNIIQYSLGPYHTLSDVERSELILEINPYHKRMTFQNGSKLLKGLEKKIKQVDDVINCPARLLEYRNLACLIDKSVAVSQVMRNTRYNRPRMKIIKEHLWGAPKGCLFSQASPYVEEFNNVLSRIYEGGLWIKWVVHEGQQQDDSPSEVDFNGNTHDKLLRKKLEMVMSLGFSFATLSFLIELAIGFFKKAKLKQVSV